MTQEAVIVDSKRTALAKAGRGSLNITEPVDYLAHTIKSVVEEVPGMNPTEIEDVIVGCGFPEGCQGMNTARIAAPGPTPDLNSPRTLETMWCTCA